MFPFSCWINLLQKRAHWKSSMVNPGANSLSNVNQVISCLSIPQGPDCRNIALFNLRSWPKKHHNQPAMYKCLGKENCMKSRVNGNFWSEFIALLLWILTPPYLVHAKQIQTPRGHSRSREIRETFILFCDHEEKKETWPKLWCCPHRHPV